MKTDELLTEQRNPLTTGLSRVSTLAMVQMINEADQTVPIAIKAVLPTIAAAIDAASNRYRQGGRIIYIGAGTSGRLGVLDAVELVPTFSVAPDRAIGLIAGGDKAMYRAVEGAEDDSELAAQDLVTHGLTDSDIVIGLAASGRTPYVLGGLAYAQHKGALAISVACTPDSAIGQLADYAIDVPVGPEVLTGSTRMKAGTAQKMVLNMLSTGIMVRNGLVWDNLMINVQATNEKLRQRAIRIIQAVCELSEEQASLLLKRAHGHVNVALKMQLSGMDYPTASARVKAANGLQIGVNER